MKNFESKENFVSEQISEFCDLFCTNSIKLSKKYDNDHGTISTNNEQEKLKVLKVSFISNPFAGNLSTMLHIITPRNSHPSIHKKDLDGANLKLIVACLKKNSDEIHNIIEEYIIYQKSGELSDEFKNFNYPQIISYTLYLATFFCDYNMANFLLNEIKYFNEESCPHYQDYLNIALYYFGTYFTANLMNCGMSGRFIEANQENYQKISTILTEKGADLNSTFIGEQSIFLKMIFSMHSEEYLISMLEHIKDVNVANKITSSNIYNENGDAIYEDMPSYLMGAIDTKKLALVKVLLNKGADANFFIQHSEDHIEHVLTCAADAGPEYLEAILNSGQRIDFKLIKNINSHINIHNNIIEKSYSYKDLIECARENIRLEDKKNSCIKKIEDREIVLINPLLNTLIEYTQHENNFKNIPSNYQKSLTLSLTSTPRDLVKYLELATNTILPSLAICKANPLIYTQNINPKDANEQNAGIYLPVEIWRKIGIYIVQDCISAKTNTQNYKSGIKFFDGYIRSLSSMLDISPLFSKTIATENNKLVTFSESSDSSESDYFSSSDEYRNDSYSSFDENGDINLIAESSDEDCYW